MFCSTDPSLLDRRIVLDEFFRYFLCLDVENSREILILDDFSVW